jgi:hypothetical protein
MTRRMRRLLGGTVLGLSLCFGYSAPATAFSPEAMDWFGEVAHCKLLLLTGQWGAFEEECAGDGPVAVGPSAGVTKGGSGDECKKYTYGIDPQSSDPCYIYNPYPNGGGVGGG